MTNLRKQLIFPVFSLFSSVGTIICCALPALMVTIGMGATLAGVISAAPWLTAISEYKTHIFTGAAIMLSVSLLLQFLWRHSACPADPTKAKACGNLRKISWFILLTSITIYIIGYFFAFLAADIFF
ncbi:MAG: hypothetical protein AAF195_04780 [Pseudomonadota bacterium]